MKFIEPVRGTQTVVTASNPTLRQVNTYNGKSWYCIDVKPCDVERELKKQLDFLNEH